MLNTLLICVFSLLITVECAPTATTNSPFSHGHQHGNEFVHQPDNSIIQDSIWMVVYLIFGLVGIATLVGSSCSLLFSVIVGIMERRFNKACRQKACKRLQSPYYMLHPTSSGTATPQRPTNTSGMGRVILSPSIADKRFRRPEPGPYSAIESSFCPAPPSRYYFPRSLYLNQATTQQSGLRGSFSIESTEVKKPSAQPIQQPKTSTSVV
ncbi:hypothetical protein M3Y98_00833400 [Aphelenchoides besseyi]|nr:hypothetical protein M3Y98_00833400 [Aphelenchoides besseyi]